MKNSNYLNLMISISIVILILLSLVFYINENVILFYSIATLLFSILDIINSYYEGKSKVIEFCDYDFIEQINKYKELLNAAKEKTVENYDESLAQIENVKKSFLNSLLNGTYKTKSAKNKGLNTPAKAAIENNKLSTEISQEFMNFYIDIINNDNSNSKTTKLDIVNFVFLLVVISIIIISPFLPENLLIPLKMDMKRVGVCITLFSLSIIFFTSFIKNRYKEKLEEMQNDNSKKMLTEFLLMKNTLDSIQQMATQKGNEFIKGVNEVGNLLIIGIEKELDKEDSKNNQAI